MLARRANGTQFKRPVPRAGLSPGCAAFAFSLVAGVLLPHGMAGAEEIGFREIEIRSFLGEPLDLRIPLIVPPSAELRAECFSIVEPNRPDDASGINPLRSLGATDLRLGLGESQTSRYLQLRSRTAYGEPVARFTLRTACPGETGREREFVALLDPAPFKVPVVVPAKTDALPAASAPASAGRARKPAFSVSAGQWLVRDGDTLQSLSSALHPRNPARQAQYREALRALNPDIAAVADDAPLAAGSQLRMPDLHELSGILPAPAVASAPAAPAAAGKGGKPRGEAAKEKPLARQSQATRAAPPAVPNEGRATNLPAEAPKAPAAAGPKPAPAARQEGFRLRLSGSEMDLSRSKNVTEQQRSLLREKQMILDADDQVAALLSLKNTVKELEFRLNEMQLRMASLPARSSAPPAVSAPPGNAPAPVKVAEKPAISPTTPAPSAPPTPAPVAAPKAEQPVTAAPAVAPPAPPRPEAKPLPPPAAENPRSLLDNLGDYVPSPLVGAGILAGLMVLAAGWFWARHRRRASPLQEALDRADQARQAAIRETTGEVAPETGHPAGDGAVASQGGWVDERMDQSATANMQSYAGHTPAPSAEDSESFDVTVKLDAPLSLDDSPARFDLDASPATTVDFPLGMEDKAGEDRVRRLQYMYERYPELMSHTVSIDDADSVLNAARLYYEEDHRDKACELLTFAVEERPQEIRFWLAQFEIFRLENMVADFAALAAKFHVLFSHAPAWPKVRHIGHELDPTNPLFAAAGRDALTGDVQFDPVAENWLNAPMDFTSEALMSDLRRALFDDHGVDRPDFESITARLAAGAAAD